MDTRLGMKAMPSIRDDDATWLAWANAYPTLVATGLRGESIDHEGARFTLSGEHYPLNPNGAVNGGVVALAADQLMGVVAARLSPEGSWPVTAVLNVQYHSPAYPPLTFEATQLPGGRSIRAVEVVVRDGEGRRCCTASGTMAIGRPGRPGRPAEAMS